MVGASRGYLPGAHKQVHAVLPLPAPGVLCVLTRKLCSILSVALFHPPDLEPHLGHVLTQALAICCHAHIRDAQRGKTTSQRPRW